MDDRGGLENRCRVTPTVGSNPTPSALSIQYPANAMNRKVRGF